MWIFKKFLILHTFQDICNIFQNLTFLTLVTSNSIQGQVDVIWIKLSFEQKTATNCLLKNIKILWKYSLFLQMHFCVVLRGFGYSSTSYSILNAETQDAQKSKSGRVSTFFYWNHKKEMTQTYFSERFPWNLVWRKNGRVWSCDHSSKRLTFRVISLTQIKVRTMNIYCIKFH